MRLRHLEIGRLPGIEPGFVLEDVSPRVNFVTGPNAVGKSSLIRALRYLVAGARPTDPPALSLSAELEDETGGRWKVQRAGSQIAWAHDGRPAEPPPLPDPEALHCYCLSMEDLLHVEDPRDERVLAELRRALAGGYDLSSLREGVFEVRPRVGQNEARAYDKTRKQLSEVKGEYATLRREEEELPELARRIDKAHQEAERARRLNEALDLTSTVEERREIEGGLATFSDGMEHLRGDELERLERLEGKKADHEEGLEGARESRGKERSKLQGTGLAEARPEQAAIKAHRERLEGGRRTRDQLQGKREGLEQQRAAEDQARRVLGPGTDPPSLAPARVSAAEELARRIHRKRNERDELAARVEEADDAPAEEDVARLERGVDAIRVWLAADPGREPVVRIALAAALVGGLVAIVAGVVAGAWPAAVGGILAAGGTVTAVLGRRGGRRAAARRFEEAGLEPPAAWERAAVRQRLDALEIRLAEVRQARARAQEGEAARRRLERVEGELEDLERAKVAFAEEVGVDPEITAQGVDHFVRYVEAYREASENRHGLEQTAQRLEEDLTRSVETVRSFLSEWGHKVDLELEEVSNVLEELDHRRRDAEAAEQELQVLEKELERLEGEIEEVEAEIAELYRTAGLDPGEKKELEERLDQLEAWKEKREAFRDAKRREGEKRAALAEVPELVQRADAADREGLQRDRDAAESEASQLEELQKRETEIRTRLEDAGRDAKLEEAAAEVDAARAALEERAHETLFAEAGQLLVDEIEQEHRTEHEPAVLRAARERFRSFTHHGWDLELDEQAGLAARDFVLEERRPLAELSSGTRMQLLLAIRLTWTRRLEEGRKGLPLFFDEALTTSDEERFRAIAESLAQLTHDEARQVFYLSARSHEVELWERATGERPTEVDVAEVRFGQAASNPENLALPETDSLPFPDGYSPEAYGAELGVPSVDPRAPDGSLHLFHLLRDDLSLLHHLMEHWRIRSLGQLEALLESSAASAAVSDPTLREQLAGRCSATRAWLAAWRYGRGRPVDRGALQASGAVSENFIEQVTNLAEELDGDGERLVAALRAGRVRRFYSSKAGELAEWLEEHGYLDPNEPLDEDGRIRRVLSEAADRAPPELTQEVVSWLEAALHDQARTG